MSYQSIFKRYEIKYLITRRQRDMIKAAMEGLMHGDEYGKSSILNIYFDTPDHLLIRRSLEKPIYKEKLRVRSYGIASQDSRVFVELKKKYDCVVYKRRISMSTQDAISYLCSGASAPAESQISNEIDYFLKLYPTLAPAMMLSYDREAYYAVDDCGFRITFDKNIRWRDSDLSLCSGAYGEALTAEDEVLMELKIIGAIPLWLSHLLSENSIYKTSFSKYGNAYMQLLDKNRKENHQYA